MRATEEERGCGKNNVVEMRRRERWKMIRPNVDGTREEERSRTILASELIP